MENGWTLPFELPISLLPGCLPCFSVFSKVWKCSHMHLFSVTPGNCVGLVVALFGCGCLMMSSLWDLTFTACFSCHMVAWVGWWRLITFDVCYTNGLCFYICHQKWCYAIDLCFSTCHQKWCRAIDLCFYIWHQRMLRATVWIFASTFDIRSDATLWIFASTFAIIGDAMRLIFASTFASRSDAMLLILLLHLPPEVMLRYWSTRHDSQKQVAIGTLFHNLPLNVMFFGWKQFSEMRKRALPTLMRICSTRHLTAPFPLKVSWFTYWKL